MGDMKDYLDDVVIDMLAEGDETEGMDVGWVEFQEGLFEEGYERRPYNSVDGRVIRKALCPVCGKKTLFPKAFTNSNKEYVLYQTCSWCDYYGEV